MIYLYGLFYSLILLFYGVHFLSVGAIEVNLLSNSSKHLSLFMREWFSYFGRSDLTLRIPSAILAFFSIILYYKISSHLLKDKRVIYFSVFIFSLLPGFIISTIILNKSIYIIFFTLLFLYLFIYYRFLSYLILLLLSVADYSFMNLFFALFFYAIYKKENSLILYSLILLGININFFHYKIGGIPHGEFLNLFIVYSSIFSPFVFFYFIFSLYKQKDRNILWFISISAFIISVVLSFRERIKIDDFAPYVVLSSVFMVTLFINGYKIRLKRFRGGYKKLFIFLFSSLLLFDIFLFYNTFFYKFLHRVKDNPVYSFHYTKEILKQLPSKRGVSCQDEVLCKQLYFYGVTKGNSYFISNYPLKGAKKIDVIVEDRVIKSVYVSKLNTNKK